MEKGLNKERKLGKSHISHSTKLTNQYYLNPTVVAIKKPVLNFVNQTYVLF
jgi:hypothetical protein